MKPSLWCLAYAEEALNGDGSGGEGGGDGSGGGGAGDSGEQGAGGEGESRRGGSDGAAGGGGEWNPSIRSSIFYNLHAR